MRIRESAIALALGIAGVSSATAQQSATPTPELDAERQAAEADLVQAETLLAAGGKRGPDGEACKLMDAYLLYIVKGAAAAGARTRIAAWPDLTWEEQNAVSQKANKRFERDKRLRSHACTASIR